MVTQLQAKERILVIGSGGIACLYGALLHKAGWQVEMVARSDHEVIRTHGIHIDSVLGDLSFRPARVYASVAEAGAADWILLCVKMLDGIDLPALVAPAMGAHTRLCLIANGIEVEAPLAAAFPHNPLISGVAFVCTSRVAPGRIEHTAFGRLLLGSYPDGASDDCQQLAAAFASTGIKAGVSNNITLERWKKSLWNASFNPLSVLTNGADTGVLLGTPQAEQLARSIMAEVIEVAATQGHELPASLIESNLDNTRAMPPYLTSMALDYLANRPIELDALVGRIVHHADAQALAIPHLRTVYELLRLRQPHGG